MLCPRCGSVEFYRKDHEKGVFCRYCDLRRFDDEEPISKESDYERAIKLRNNLDFEDAIDLLEGMIDRHPDSAELQFQMLLATYGVSYVGENDELGGTPTLNRISKQPLNESPFYQRLLSLDYDEEKKKRFLSAISYIEELRQKTISLMASQEPYDIFLCYKRTHIDDPTMYTPDSVTARRLYNKFSNYGFKVFFAEETLLSRHLGAEYEPIIYSAINTAKVMIVIASTNDPRFLSSKWVKNEWSRFLLRISDGEEGLLLLPVFDNGVSEKTLPAKLKKFEGLPLNDEFDAIVLPRLQLAIGHKRLSGIQNIIVEEKIEQIKLKETTLQLNQARHYDSRALSASEQTYLQLAKAEMDVGHFDSAKTRLDALIRSNPMNFQANLAMICCDFEAKTLSAVTYASFKGKDINIILNHAKNMLAVAKKEESEEIVSQFLEWFAQMLINDLPLFAKLLGNEGLVFFVLGHLSKNDLNSFVLRARPLFLQSIHHSKGGEAISSICEGFFRILYSNMGEKGALELSSLYREIGLSRKKTRYFESALEINPNDHESMICLFSLCNGVAGSFGNKLSLAESFVSSFMKEDSSMAFQRYQVEEHERKRDKNNLFSLLVDLLRTGFVIDTTDQNFIFALFIASTKAGCVEINQGVAEFFSPTLLKDKRTMDILHEMGEHLLLEGKIDFARSYFEQCLICDEYDVRAKWGLFKIELGYTSNYDFLLKHVDMLSYPSFSSVIELFNQDNRNANRVNPYLEFYKDIENENSSNGFSSPQNRIETYKAHKNNCLALKLDDEVSKISAALRAGTYVKEATANETTLKQKAEQVKQEQLREDVRAEYKKSNNAEGKCYWASFIFYVVATLAASLILSITTANWSWMFLPLEGIIVILIAIGITGFVAASIVTNKIYKSSGKKIMEKHGITIYELGEIRKSVNEEFRQKAQAKKKKK